MNRHCVLFLARKPTEKLQQTVRELKSLYAIDSYIISDTPTDCNCSIHITNDECMDNNYIYATHPKFCGFPLSSRDRGLYFSAERSNYDYYWFVEDGIYFKDTQVLYSMIEKFINLQYDLVATEYKTPKKDPRWDHWHVGSELFEKPTAFFQPLCRVSKKLLQQVSAFVKEYNRLAFHELMLGSLAADNNMSFVEIRDVTPFVQLRYRPVWTKEEIDKKSNCILHPCKYIL